MHGKSRLYPLDFSLNDYARILHGVLETESIKGPMLVGQLLGGYVAQAFIDLYPGETFDFVSIDLVPPKKKYYPTWEVRALQHVKNMHRSMSWSWLKSLGSWGVATAAEGKASMHFFMESCTRKEYVELTTCSYTIFADAVESGRAYDADCPALLLYGERGRASDVRVFSRK